MAKDLPLSPISPTLHSSFRVPTTTIIQTRLKKHTPVRIPLVLTSHHLQLFMRS